MKKIQLVPVFTTKHFQKCCFDILFFSVAFWHLNWTTQNHLPELMKIVRKYGERKN